MKKLFWIASAFVFTCLTFVAVIRPTFDSGSSTRTAEEEARIREVLHQMLVEYKTNNQLALETFEKNLTDAGASYFNKARANIRPFTAKMEKFGYCSELCYAITKDYFCNTKTAQEMISPEITRMFAVPCEKGHQEILRVLNDFLRKIQENDTKFKAGLMQFLDDENFAISNLSSCDDFLAQNMKLSNEIQQYAFSKTTTVIFTAADIAMIQMTYNAITALTRTVVGRLTASYAAGGTCAVADGPLPFLDILGGIIAIGGTIWSACDIYDVTVTLPAELKKHMNTMINNYQKKARLEALTHANRILQLCEANCEKITKNIE